MFLIISLQVSSPFLWRWCSIRGSDGRFQDQDVASDVGCAFDGVAAGKPETAFSDGQVGLP